jgi:hypothetical protein
MQRPVTHPFEVRAHPQAGDDRAQVSGYRLLAGEQVECAALQVMMKIIDQVVGFDHGLGELETASSRWWPWPSPSRPTGHLDQLVADRVKPS